MKALHDPVPLRRAIAVEVLCGSGHAEVFPEVRKLLTDGKSQVRMRAALALVQQLDEKAIGVLIDLLVDLPVAERVRAEEAAEKPRRRMVAQSSIERRRRGGA